MKIIQEDKNDVEENKLDKDNILKMLLIISLLPFILILLRSIYSIFFGITVGFFGNQTPTYGFEAFEIGIVFGILALFEKGTLQICLAYQLFYLTRHLIKKHKIKTTNVNKNIEQ